MNFFLPGRVVDVSQIDPGTCILFSIDDTMHAGLVVKQKDGEKFILDFECDDKQGGTKFHIYGTSHFENEPMVALQEARIVPHLGAGYMAMGQHARGKLSRVLYMTDHGPVVHAGFQQVAYKINLNDGSIYHGDLAYQLRTESWVIELPDGTGDFWALRSFTA